MEYYLILPTRVEGSTVQQADMHCFAAPSEPNNHLVTVRRTEVSHTLNPMAVEEESTSSAAFLETVEGEISFFRSVMRARPVGIHRHFHVLSIQHAIQKDTGQLVSTDDIWEKLKASYDLDALEGLVG
jgi:hypothetical protein